MKEKAIFLAKFVTISVPIMATSLPLHWMLRGGARLYGLLCKIMWKLDLAAFPGEAAEAVVLIEDLRKAGINMPEKEFLEIINSYYNAREIED